MKKIKAVVGLSFAMTMMCSVFAFAKSSNFADGRATGSLYCYHSGEMRSHSADTNMDGGLVSLMVTATYDDGSTYIYDGGRDWNHVETSSGYEWTEDYSSVHKAYEFGGFDIGTLRLSVD